MIDEGTYTARLRGRPLVLTYKEFELLKYLAQHAGRVFTRAQLLHEYGDTIFSAAPARSMSMCGGCGPNSDRSTNR